MVAAARARIASMLLLVAALIGLVEAVLAPLFWQQVLNATAALRRVLPPAAYAGLDLGHVERAVTMATGYALLLGVVSLAAVPAAALRWRCWPPARVLAPVVAAVLALGQLAAAAIAVLVRHVAGTSLRGAGGVPPELAAVAARTVLPGWYLPTAVTLAAVAAVALVLAAVLAALPDPATGADRSGRRPAVPAPPAR